MIAPTPADIVGTYEMTPGVALAAVEFVDGEVLIDYEGETEMYWDSQETVTGGDGTAIYIDSDGHHHTEGYLLKLWGSA